VVVGQFVEGMVNGGCSNGVDRIFERDSLSVWSLGDSGFRNVDGFEGGRNIKRSFMGGRSG